MINCDGLIKWRKEAGQYVFTGNDYVLNYMSVFPQRRKYLTLGYTWDDHVRKKRHYPPSWFGKNIGLILLGFYIKPDLLHSIFHSGDITYEIGGAGCVCSGFKFGEDKSMDEFLINQDNDGKEFFFQLNKDYKFSYCEMRNILHKGHRTTFKINIDIDKWSDWYWHISDPEYLYHERFVEYYRAWYVKKYPLSPLAMSRKGNSAE